MKKEYSRHLVFSTSYSVVASTVKPPIHSHSLIHSFFRCTSFNHWAEETSTSDHKAATWQEKRYNLFIMLVIAQLWLPIAVVSCLFFIFCYSNKPQITKTILKKLLTCPLSFNLYTCLPPHCSGYLPTHHLSQLTISTIAYNSTIADCLPAGPSINLLDSNK